MTGKAEKKRLKEIQKEIKALRKEMANNEFRPCQCDADLRQKDEDLKMLRAKILALENEKDRFMLKAGDIDRP
ncbi:hypothetical protein ACFL4N_06885 [Thermodesulfobacteriota bacterium]